MIALSGLSSDAVASAISDIDIPKLQLSKNSTHNITNTALRFSTSQEEPIPTHKNLVGWLKKQKAIDDFSLFGGTYWYVINLTNDTNINRWVVNVSSSVIETIDYVIYDANGQRQQSSGYHAPDEFFFTYGRSFQQKHKATMTLLIRLDSPVYTSAPIARITSLDEFNRTQLTPLIIILFCLGALLTLTIYNGFLYIGAQQKELIYYTAYLLSLFSGWALIFQIPTEFYHFQYIHWHYIAFALLPYFGGRFCILFLELDATNPLTAAALRYLGNTSAIAGILLMFVSAYGHAIISAFLVLWLALTIYAGLIKWQQNFKSAKYFTMAYLCLLLPGLMKLPANMGLITDISESSQIIALLGTTLDAILLAFAIAHRMRLLANENRQLNLELEHKVASRTKKLQALNQQLMSANESRRQFVANVGHEIRTPMTSIIGFSELIKHNTCSESERKQYSDVICSSSQHLLSIVNDLLDMTKIEEKKLSFNFESVNIANLLHQLEQENITTARKKGLEFECHIIFPIPSVINSDPIRIKQILLNLISNALKFTSQGHVRFTVELVDKKLLFSVQDTGVGISDEQTQHIFCAFEQGDNSISRRFGGTGLGLHLSQQLAHGLNGELSFTTELAVGSTFTLALPLGVCDERHWISSMPDYDSGYQKQCTSPLDEQFDLSHITVLVADDCKDNLKIISLMLKQHVKNVTCVDNGQEALTVIKNQPFDLILLDINMPLLDGLSAMKRLKQQGFIPPIIALTANSMTHQVIELINAGFDGHIAKPIDKTNFFQTITQVFQNSTTQ